MDCFARARNDGIGQEPPSGDDKTAITVVAPGQLPKRTKIRDGIPIMLPDAARRLSP